MADWIWLWDRFVKIFNFYPMPPNMNFYEVVVLEMSYESRRFLGLATKQIYHYTGYSGYTGLFCRHKN